MQVQFSSVYMNYGIDNIGLGIELELPSSELNCLKYFVPDSELNCKNGIDPGSDLSSCMMTKLFSRMTDY